MASASDRIQRTIDLDYCRAVKAQNRRKPAAPVDLDAVTPVIFRKFQDGEIIALFPFHAGNADGYTCQSFIHVGQHGSADPGLVMRMTKPATEDEAAPLIRELTSAPYNYPPLRILHRFTPAARRERERQVQR